MCSLVFKMKVMSWSPAATLPPCLFFGSSTNNNVSRTSSAQLSIIMECDNEAPDEACDESMPTLPIRLLDRLSVPMDLKLMQSDTSVFLNEHPFIAPIGTLYVTERQVRPFCCQGNSPALVSITWCLWCNQRTAVVVR
jgi:hypothetical protein